MSKPAALAATVIAIPLVVFGCGGGAEWHPIAGPSVIPAAPAPEPMRPGGHAPPKKMAKHSDDDAPPPPPAPTTSASAASSSSAKPAGSAPKAPPPPPKKK